VSHGNTTDAAQAALHSYAEAVEAESSEGRALVHDLADNPICSVTIDHSLPCVCVVWKRYVTSLQLRFVHEGILGLLARHGLDKIVADDTELPTIHTDDQDWIVNDWMPRAIKAGLRIAASKRSALHFGRISIDRIKAEAPSGLTIRHFDNLAETRAWISLM
jgi:hypothetical protein